MSRCQWIWYWASFDGPETLAPKLCYVSYGIYDISLRVSSRWKSMLESPLILLVWYWYDTNIHDSRNDPPPVQWGWLATTISSSHEFEQWIPLTSYPSIHGRGITIPWYTLIFASDSPVNTEKIDSSRCFRNYISGIGATSSILEGYPRDTPTLDLLRRTTSKDRCTKSILVAVKWIPDFSIFPFFFLFLHYVFMILFELISRFFPWLSFDLAVLDRFMLRRR